MKSMVYLAGRTLQLIGLITMPAAMWTAQFDRNERLSIAVFLGSILVFGLGYGLTRIK